MRKTVLLGVVAAMLMAVPLAASAGVSGPAFYVDGEAYRTVGTPTDFTNTGAPDHSFDTIYAFSDQMNVAEAAPGDRDYNGGRWMVEVVEYVDHYDYESAVAEFDHNGSGNFDSAEEVEAAIRGGAITTSAGPSFECPVIPLPRGRS